MTIRQLTVFLENKPGFLNQLLSILSDNKINIIALTVADTTDYGIVRMLVSDPELAQQKIREQQLSVRIHDVLSLEMDAAPGSLSKILNYFNDAEIGIEYIYAFSFGSKSIVVLRTDNRDKAEQVIRTNQLKTIKEEDLR